MARSLAGTWAAGHTGGFRYTPVRGDACLPTGSVGQKPGRHLCHWKRGGIPTNAGPKEMQGSPRVRLASAKLSTGSVGQKPGRNLGRWKRGAISTNAGPKAMSGFPRLRLARGLAGTWAIGDADGFRQTPVGNRCRSPHGFGWPEDWPTPGPLETRRDLDKRLSERYVMLPTGSVDQKPGRYLGRWKRGGI